MIVSPVKVLPPRQASTAILVLALAAWSVVAHWSVINSGYAHPDEQIAEHVVGRVLAERTVDTNWVRSGVGEAFRYDQFNFSSYYLSVAALEVLSGLGAGDASDHDALRRHLREMSCLFAGIAVVFAGLIAWRLARSAGAAFLAALLTASNVTLFQDSIYARPEAFFTAATLLFVLLMTSGKLRVAVVLLLTSTIGGFLLAAKISFAPMLPLPLLIAAGRAHAGSGSLTSALSRPAATTALYLAGIALGFALGAPYAVAAPTAYMHGVGQLLRQYADGFWPHGIPDAGFVERFGFGVSYLAYTTGVLVASLAILGYVMLIRRRDAVFVLALSGPLLTLLYFLQTRTFFERNFSHVLPLVFVLAAFAASGLARRIRLLLLPRWPVLCTQPRSSLLFAGTASILLAYPSLAVSAKLYRLLRDNDYRRLIADEQDRVSAGGVLPVRTVSGLFQIQKLQHELCGKMAYSAYDPGDRYTRAKLTELIDSGWRIDGAVYSPFHGSPTSTLWSYHATDILFLLPPGGGEEDCPAELTPLRDDPDLIAARAAVQTTGAWADKGFPKGMQTGDWRFPLYASWIGNDALTGQLTVGPFAACGPVVVPFATGAVADNLRLSVERIHSDHTETLFADHPPRVGVWNALRIRAPADSCATYVVHAEDNGTGWGQWIGIGMPATTAAAQAHADAYEASVIATAAQRGNP